MKTDKRSVERVPFRVSAILKTNNREIRSETTEDLSVKGVFVLTEEFLEEETPCQVLLELSGTSSDLRLRMEGRVARVRPGKGMGIEFTTLDLEVYTLLKNIVEYNSGSDFGQSAFVFEDEE
jgi:hypothetical protein